EIRVPDSNAGEHPRQADAIAEAFEQRSGFLIAGECLLVLTCHAKQLAQAGEGLGFALPVGHIAPEFTCQAIGTLRVGDLLEVRLRVPKVEKCSRLAPSVAQRSRRSQSLAIELERFASSSGEGGDVAEHVQRIRLAPRAPAVDAELPRAF